MKGFARTETYAMAAVLAVGLSLLAGLRVTGSAPSTAPTIPAALQSSLSQFGRSAEPIDQPPAAFAKNGFPAGDNATSVAYRRLGSVGDVQFYAGTDGAQLCLEYGVVAEGDSDSLRGGALCDTIGAALSSGLPFWDEDLHIAGSLVPQGCRVTVITGSELPVANDLTVVDTAGHDAVQFSLHCDGSTRTNRFGR